MNVTIHFNRKGSIASFQQLPRLRVLIPVNSIDKSFEKNMNADTKHTRSRYDLSAPVYDLAEWPMEKLKFRKWRPIIWEKAEGPQVLEIAIGTGKNISYYPDGIEVTGIDISSRMLKRARAYITKHDIKNVRVHEMDAQQLEFEDNTFDSAVATFAFCSIPDPVRALKEALRVVKPAGKLHLLEHMLSKKAAQAKVMKQLDAPIHYLFGVHIARKTVENVSKAGWNIVHVEELTSNGIFRFIDAVKPELDKGKSRSSGEGT